MLWGSEMSFCRLLRSHRVRNGRTDSPWSLGLGASAGGKGFAHLTRRVCGGNRSLNPTDCGAANTRSVGDVAATTAVAPMILYAKIFRRNRSGSRRRPSSLQYCGGTGNQLGITCPILDGNGFLEAPAWRVEDGLTANLFGMCRADLTNRAMALSTRCVDWTRRLPWNQGEIAEHAGRRRSSNSTLCGDEFNNLL